MLHGEILTMDDFDLKGKTILIRCDLNSPVARETGIITDDTKFFTSMTHLDLQLE